MMMTSSLSSVCCLFGPCPLAFAFGVTDEHRDPVTVGVSGSVQDGETTPPPPSKVILASAGGSMFLIALAPLFALLACSADGASGDSATADDSAAGFAGGSDDEGLWDSPGAEGAASRFAADGLAACQADWQADAHVGHITTNTSNPFGGDPLANVVCFSVSDTANVCQYGNQDFAATITPNAQYAPGWAYQPTDHIGGWAVDNGDVYPGEEKVPHTFIVTPAQHRRQTGWLLDGVPDNYPVILVDTGSLAVLDGVTGEKLEPTF
jgi:hypothetical protein